MEDSKSAFVNNIFGINVRNYTKNTRHFGRCDLNINPMKIKHREVLFSSTTDRISYIEMSWPSTASWMHRYNKLCRDILNVGVRQHRFDSSAEAIHVGIGAALL